MSFREQIKEVNKNLLDLNLAQDYQDIIEVLSKDNGGEPLYLPAREKPTEEGQYPTVEEIFRAMDKFAPWLLAESWDPTGFQIGSAKKQVRTVFLALDLSRRILSSLDEFSADLLLTHHPVLFSPVQSLTTEQSEAANILELCRFERAMISAHTNVDRGIFGTATAMLSSFLGDCDLNQLVESSEVLDPWEELGGLGHGRVLSLEEPRTFVDCVKSLELSFAQPRLWAFPGYSRKPDSKLSRIAFCPGAFSEDFLPLVKKAGVEMVVSGEVKHHLQLAIHDLGCDLVMLNHDVSERVVMPIILAYLRRLFPSLNFALDRGIDYTLETSN